LPVSAIDDLPIIAITVSMLTVGEDVTMSSYVFVSTQ